VPIAYVTGGTGFIGQHLVEQLLAAGWQVHALHRASSNTQALQLAGAHLVQAQLLDPDPRIPQGADVVFHVAADTTIWRPHAQRQLRTNVDGTENIARASLKAGAGRLVFVSSVSAWGTFDRVITEQAPQHGADSRVTYKRSKHLAEDRVRDLVDNHGLDAVIVNPCHVMGPYDRGTWARLITMVHDGTLPGVPSGTGVFSDARQVARALIAAAEHGRTGQNYLLGGPRASFLELARTIGRVLDQPVPERPTPDLLLRAVALARDAWSRVSGVEPDITPDGLSHVLLDLRVDDSRAREELGYAHTPLHDLVSDTVDWMREAGRLG